MVAGEWGLYLYSTFPVTLLKGSVYIIRYSSIHPLTHTSIYWWRRCHLLMTWKPQASNPHALKMVILCPIVTLLKLNLFVNVYIVHFKHRINYRNGYPLKHLTVMNEMKPAFCRAFARYSSEDVYVWLKTCGGGESSTFLTSNHIQNRANTSHLSK